jgi:hypothetical protein
LQTYQASRDKTRKSKIEKEKKEQRKRRRKTRWALSTRERGLS